MAGAELIFTGAACRRDTQGFWLCLKVQDEPEAKRFVYGYPQGTPYRASLDKPRKSRSLDANAYLWVLCQKIAQAVGSTKEEVYRECVKRKGQFVIVPIREDALDTFTARWGGQGVGWPVEVLDNSKLEGYKKVIAYYGSSTYNSQEMSALLDEVISEAKLLGIPTETPDEIALMKARWDDVG